MCCLCVANLAEEFQGAAMTGDAMSANAASLLSACIVNEAGKNRGGMIIQMFLTKAFIPPWEEAALATENSTQCVM